MEPLTTEDFLPKLTWYHSSMLKKRGKCLCRAASILVFMESGVVGKVTLGLITFMLQCQKINQQYAQM